MEVGGWIGKWVGGSPGGSAGGWMSRCFAVPNVCGARREVAGREFHELAPGWYAKVFDRLLPKDEYPCSVAAPYESREHCAKRGQAFGGEIEALLDLTEYACRPTEAERQAVRRRRKHQIRRAPATFLALGRRRF